MRPNLIVAMALAVTLGIPAVCAAKRATREFTDPTEFEAATRSRVAIGFNGILSAGTSHQSFNLLSVCGTSFATPNPNTFVNVTRADFYLPHRYPTDFIVDSSNPSSDNQLVISLREPTHAVALEYGGLGFNGAGVGTIRLSNGHVFTTTLPTVGRTQFIGFLTAEAITSITLVTMNDSWVLTQIILGDNSRRATTDRRDNSKDQIHLMYVLPCDGDDQRLDTNGTIATSVEVAQRWLEDQTEGQRLRVDRRGRRLDITFVRLGRTDSDLATHGIFLRDELEKEVHAAGFNDPDKIYAVYYGGRSTAACAGAPLPPVLVGNVVALYLFGEPPGAPPCHTNQFASAGGEPGYWEFVLVHEILHALGLVAACAPNHTAAGHTSDDPRDLMYAGPLAWQPSILDIGRDDYFAHPNDTCLDLRDSTFLTGRRPRR
jgi:hypothetical protein